jgi:myo-inositol-1(or 4)-monophosphatase
MITTDLLDRALDEAVRAALEAGSLIRAEAGRVDARTVADKGIHDLVTEVDTAAERLILSRLSGAFPEFGRLAEEDPSTHAAGLPASGFRWIVDPIDGTTNFAHGVPPYAVSIALEHGSGILVGVVYDVPHDELFTAVRGRGLRVNGRPAGVSRTNALGDSLVTTGFPYRSFGHADAYLGVLKAFMERTRGVRRPGSASVDLAYVACGRFDGFFESGLRPWDVAAGCLLVTEAGGRVSDYAGNGDPVFDRQIVASNGRIHPDMLDVLAPMRAARD